MNWSEYEAAIRRACREIHGIPPDRTRLLLERARRLYDQELPVILDQKNLAWFLGFDISLVMCIANRPHKYYRCFRIPKRNGGFRELHEPLPTLKEMQRVILDLILARLPVDPAAKAYQPGSSVKGNATYHTGQPLLLKLDVSDFFGSLHEYQVYQVFHNLGYHRQVATLLAKLCCLNGSLPQGAPTSPALSNLILREADRRIFHFCHQANIRYTRYADDLTFSGDFNPGQVIRRVASVIETLGLRLNSDKTRVIRRHRRQEVTGVVVNNGLRASRSRRMYLRQQLHYLGRFGLMDQAAIQGTKPHLWISHLLGLAGFIRFLDPSDQEAIRAIATLKTLRQNTNQV